MIFTMENMILLYVSEMSTSGSILLISLESFPAVFAAIFGHVRNKMEPLSCLTSAKVVCKHIGNL